MVVDHHGVSYEVGNLDANENPCNFIFKRAKVLNLINYCRILVMTLAANSTASVQK